MLSDSRANYANCRWRSAVHSGSLLLSPGTWCHVPGRWHRSNRYLDWRHRNLEAECNASCCWWSAAATAQNCCDPARRSFSSTSASCCAPYLSGGQSFSPNPNIPLVRTPYHRSLAIIGPASSFAAGRPNERTCSLVSRAARSRQACDARRRVSVIRYVGSATSIAQIVSLRMYSSMHSLLCCASGIKIRY
jgi:hypothetical protein